MDRTEGMQPISAAPSPSAVNADILPEHLNQSFDKGDSAPSSVQRPTIQDDEQLENVDGCLDDLVRLLEQDESEEDASQSGGIGIQRASTNTDFQWLFGGHGGFRGDAGASSGGSSSGTSTVRVCSLSGLRSNLNGFQGHPLQNQVTKLHEFEDFGNLPPLVFTLAE